jgi:hypothetical protein
MSAPFDTRAATMARMRALLADWAHVAEDVSNDFAVVAHLLREASLSRDPGEALDAVRCRMDDCGSTLAAWADDIDFNSQPGAAEEHGEGRQP